MDLEKRRRGTTVRVLCDVGGNCPGNKRVDVLHSHVQHNHEIVEVSITLQESQEMGICIFALMNLASVLVFKAKDDVWRVGECMRRHMNLAIGILGLVTPEDIVRKPLKE